MHVKHIPYTIPRRPFSASEGHFLQSGRPGLLSEVILGGLDGMLNEVW